MPLPGQSSSPSPYQKPSFSSSERLGVSKPAAPKKEVAPQPQSKPGLFRKEGYASFWQQRGFARKSPYEALPGTSRKLGKEERVGLVKELEERAKKIGQFHGLSERTYRERILPQMRKEKYKLHIAGKINEEKVLERKMQEYEKWIKGA